MIELTMPNINFKDHLQSLGRKRTKNVEKVVFNTARYAGLLEYGGIMDYLPEDAGGIMGEVEVSYNDKNQAHVIQYNKRNENPIVATRFTARGNTVIRQREYTRVIYRPKAAMRKTAQFMPVLIGNNISGDLFHHGLSFAVIDFSMNRSASQALSIVRGLSQVDEGTYRDSWFMRNG